MTLFAKNSDFSGSLLLVDCRHLLVKISHETYATSKRSLYSRREKHKKERQKMFSSCLLGRQQQTTEKVLNSWGNFSHSLFFMTHRWDKFAGKEGRLWVICENFWLRTTIHNHFYSDSFTIFHIWNIRRAPPSFTWVLGEMKKIETKSTEFSLNEVLVWVCKLWYLDPSPKQYFVIPPMLWMARSNENHQLEIILVD